MVGIKNLGMQMLRGLYTVKDWNFLCLKIFAVS